jgi:hypothetical protein
MKTSGYGQTLGQVRGVQGGATWFQKNKKKRAIIFPVGSKFNYLPIDGYELSLNPGAIVELI